MGAKRIVGLIALATVVALAVISCGVAPVTIDDRLNDFLSSLNSSTRSDMQGNFHPTDTQDYSTLPNFDWTTPFPLVNSDTAYSLSSIDETDPTNVTAVITGPAAFGTGSPAIKFVMEIYGTDDYRIEQLWLGTSQSNLTNIIR